MSENDLENEQTEADKQCKKRKRSLSNARPNVDSDIYEISADQSGETEADGKGGSTGKQGVPNNQSNNVDSDIYEMCGNPCGKCIIFNQNFSNHCNLKTRYGTNFDRDRLHNLFCWLKFKVIIYEDNTKDEMEEILQVEALDDKNKEFKCLVVCILSHGEEGGIYTADGKFIKLHEILRRFDTSRCRLMENKPKIFIVQACRIESNLIYINPARVPSEKNEESTGIAINADQILYQSTSYGSSALRNTHYGSSFIQTFCNVYEKKASESSFDDLALEINKRVGDTNLIMCAIEPNRLRKKLYFKPDTPFNVNKDTQPHLIKTRWKVTIISHSPKKCIEEIEKQAKKFKIKDKSNKHILIDRGPNEAESMRFNHWKEKECNEYVKRYYGNVDFFLFNYGSTDDIPDGFKSFIKKNKPSFVIRNYNLFKHFDFLKRADALTFQQKESLKRIKHMDHIGFDPKRNAIYFFKISDRNTVHDIRVDVDDCAAFVRIFFLLHRRELINKITCLVSFVVVPTESLLENVSNRCDNCEQYLITEEQFQKFDQKLCDKIRKTVSCANKKDRIKLTDEELKEFKYNMKGIFACMATQDGNLIPNLTENTAEQLKHIEIFLYPQQMEIANFNDEHVILKGSYGSGKTVIGRLLVKHLCFDSPNELIYYINCGTSSDFTEDMENYVKCIDKNINVVCLHSKKALGIILKEIKQNNSSAAKIHLIFEEVSLDEFTDKDILSFCAALNREPFHNTFCYIICQAMSNERSFTKNGVHYKRSFSNQEEILKEKSAFKMKKLEIAARNTQNIDQLIEIGMKHLENAVNKFFFKTIENFEFQKGTSSESFKQKKDKKEQIIQSLIQTSNAENISAEEQTHEEEINKEPFNKRPFKAKEILSNLDASLKNVNILDNILHENQEDHVKRYLESRFQYIKHSDLLHQIQGNKPRVYFPLDKKDDYDQFEEAYLLMQCFRDLLNDFFDNDENIILIHFENNIPQTISKAINLFEMIEQTKVENILFKTCLDVQGLEYKNVIIVLDIGEYHMRHYLIEAMARCKENLAFLVVKESLKGTDQDLILNIIQEWEEKDLIAKFNQYSTKKLSEHKERYERFLRVRPIQSSDDEIKKKMESIEEYLSLYKPIDSKEEDSSSEGFNINANTFGHNIQKPGWDCRFCPTRNLPTMPSCDVCFANRPPDYKVPDGYLLSPAEEFRLLKEKQDEELARKWQEDERRKEEEEARKNYRLIEQLNQLRVIPNTEMFECPICFKMIEPGEGVMLRECLHNTCRNCLAAHINASEDAEPCCPMHEGFPCPAVITQQEIQELLSEEEYQKYLDKSLKLAESQAKAFHCRTVNCKGFCFLEDEVNEFPCPICHALNCITCRAIHQDMTCKQYQDELILQAQNNEDYKKTQQMMERMIERGDAMHCPQCEIVLQKKSGCDWMRCTMCKTEICWATKGRRWGPKGNGDTSGGCRCGVNGRRCADNCGNCH